MSFQKRTTNILGEPNVEIPTLRIRVAQIKLQYSAFAVRTLERIMNEEIIGEIHNKMRADGISQKIIDGTTLGRNVTSPSRNKIRWNIVSSYEAINGFNVAVMIERGRKAYVIFPKKAKVLAFVPKGGTGTVFSAFAKIPPYRARKFVANTIRDKKKVVQGRLNSETVKWMKSILRI